jgi:hypothetical protein
LSDAPVKAKAAASDYPVATTCSSFSDIDAELQMQRIKRLVQSFIESDQHAAASQTQDKTAAVQASESTDAETITAREMTTLDAKTD